MRPNFATIKLTFVACASFVSITALTLQYKKTNYNHAYAKHSSYREEFYRSMSVGRTQQAALAAEDAATTTRESDQSFRIQPWLIESFSHLKSQDLTLLGIAQRRVGANSAADISLSAAAAEHQNIDSYVALAGMYFDLGNTRQSKIYWETATRLEKSDFLQQSLHHSQAHLRQSFIAFQSMDYLNAAIFAIRARQANPANYGSYLAIARPLHKMNLFEGALKVLGHSRIRSFPDAALLRSEILRAAQLPQQTEDELIRDLRLRRLSYSGDHVPAMIALGRILNDQGDSAGAIRWLQRAQKIRPNDLNIKFHLARAFVENKQLDQAELVFGEMLTKNKRDIRALAGLASVYFLNGRISDSNALLHQFTHQTQNLRLDSNELFGQAHLIQGYLLETSGSFDRAISAYQDAIRLSPRNRAARLGLSRVFAQKADCGTARSVLTDADYIAPHFDLSSSNDSIQRLISGFDQPKNLESLCGLTLSAKERF